MKALVVVDMQNDFITGSLGSPMAEAIVPNVRAKIRDYRRNGDLIVFTRDTHRANYLDTREGKKLPVEHCIKRTFGWEIAEGLVWDECIVDKMTFGSTRLVKYLTHEYWYNKAGHFTEIEIIGLCTDICVVSNALLLKSAFYDYCEITVDATCCAGVTPETHEAALRTMEMCQINVKRG